MKILDVPRSGSYQGITSSRNRFGQYVRNRATPVNPASSAQGVVRARMSANAAAWRSISEGQRAGWESLGLSMTRTDSLGQTYSLNGFAAYCSVNNNRDLIGAAQLDDAPALDTPDAILTATITLSSAAFSIAFTPTPQPTGTFLLAFASPQGSAGRSFEADLRFILAGSTATASPLVILTAYTAKFGVPVATNKIFVSLLASRGGFVSGPFLTSKVVA